MTSAQTTLQSEKAAHASDMTSAQTTLQSEKAAHLSDVAGLQSAFTAEKTAHQNDVALANAKHNALVKLYNAKAKKYHFATIK